MPDSLKNRPMAKGAVDRLLDMLNEGLSKLSPSEQRQVLRRGDDLLEARRARLSKPAEPAKEPAEKLGKIRAAR
jgi:hypothetical protein